MIKNINNSPFEDWKPSDYHPSPLFSKNQLTIFKELRLTYKSDDWVIMACCPLTAFFDPEKLNLKGYEIKDLLSQSALFVIAKGKQGQEVTPYLFVLDLASIETDTDLFLESQGMDFKVYNEKTDPEVFLNILKKHLAEKISTQIGGRQPINKTEKLVASTLMAYGNFWPLHEVTPSRLVPAALRNDPKIQKKLASAGPIDIVLYDINKNSPVICIEVDGKHHREAYQKTKDKNKTDLLFELGLPLVRILPDEMKNWNQEQSSAGFYFYTKIISTWICSQARRHAEERDIEIVESKFIQKRQECRLHLAKAIFGKDYSRLTLEQKSEIESNDTILDLHAEEYYELLTPPDHDLNSEVADNAHPYIPSRLEGNLKNVKIEGDLKIGMTAQGVLRVGSKVELIKSPTLFLSDPLRSRENLFNHLHSLTLKFLFWQADMILRNNSHRSS